MVSSALSPTAPGRKRTFWPFQVLILAAATMVIFWQGGLYLSQEYANEQSRYMFNATQHILNLEKFIQSTESTVSKNLSRQTSDVTQLISQLQRSASTTSTAMAQKLNEMNGTIQQTASSLSAILNTLASLDERLTSQQNEQKRMSEKRLEQEQKENSLLGKRLASLESLFSWVRQSVLNHLSENPVFWPIKDEAKFHIRNNDGTHGIFSGIVGRGLEEGPPELFYFPSNISNNRLLCLMGTDSSDGAKNSYTYAWPDALPRDAVFVPGTTLVSDTYWDYYNPWHSMYNLIQFVYWRMEERDHAAADAVNSTGECREAAQLVLYHWGELRLDMGDWIENILRACGVPTNIQLLDNYGGNSVCLEKAILSRSGIGGIRIGMLKRLFEEARCNARRACGIPVVRTGPSSKPNVRISLVSRSGQRAFKNLTEWEVVVQEVCRKVTGCQWSTVHVSDLTFCQQVEVMTTTDVLVSVHGAQLTNMIFMSPGSRILEMFPPGWLENAGHGQFIYSHLARWVGLIHEGYWRDSADVQCPDSKDCFSFYKDQPVGINTSHITPWLAQVVQDFNTMQADQLLPVHQRIHTDFNLSWDVPTCVCAPINNLTDPS